MLLADLPTARIAPAKIGASKSIKTNPGIRGYADKDKDLKIFSEVLIPDSIYDDLVKKLLDNNVQDQKQPETPQAREEEEEMHDSFFFKFKGLNGNAVGKTDSSSDVRIYSALVNPAGDDTDKETVSLINSSNFVLDLKGWTIEGNNGNAYTLIDAKLDARETRTFNLPFTDIQLVNQPDQSATITLRDANEKIVDTVNYDKKDIKSGSVLACF